ncbi:MAG: HD-GYP domain-containing protein [Planctomycetota bacterium]
MSTTDLQRGIKHLKSRLAEIGLPLVAISDIGKPKIVSESSWFERKILKSSEFLQALSVKRKLLDNKNNTMVLVLPNVYLMALTYEQSSGKEYDCQASLLTLIIAAEFYENEALYRICSQLEIDVDLAIQRIKRDHLYKSTEVVYFAKMLRWMREDINRLNKQRNELRGLSVELSHNYEELSLLYNLSGNMTLDQRPDIFLQQACCNLQAVTQLRWISLLITPSMSKLGCLAGAFYVSGPIHDDQSTKRLGKALLNECEDKLGPIICDDTACLNNEASFLSRNLLAVPLIRNGQVMGVLYGGDRLDGSHIDSVTTKLCTSLGDSLTIFLENLSLLEDSRSLFVGTLHALTSAIDAKDSYTFGHSERVAYLSKMLSTKAGIESSITKRIYLAGLIHDIGKIGVPESVLSKPGRLSEEEFEQIRAHPRVGANILADIRQMDDLIPGVLYHHECWDGSGYPEKLAGLNIPLFGRVIGLADAFDAMSSNRTYRSALGHEEVLDEIRKYKGRQFDPELSDLFLAMDFTSYFEMIEQHRISIAHPVADFVGKESGY